MMVERKGKLYVQVLCTKLLDQFRSKSRTDLHNCIIYSQAQHDEANHAVKHSEATKLLNEWGLAQYIQIMLDEGWDEPELWDCITDDTFQNVLHFKSGHIAKFKSKLAAWKSDPSQDLIPMTMKLVLLGDTRVGKSLNLLW